ncbi:hypothetical protein QZH41_019059, partial [Actinostola sp. cb2023]
MANVLVRFAKMRNCARLCRIYHSKPSHLLFSLRGSVSLCRYQRREDIQRHALNARTFCVSKTAAKNWRPSTSTDDGDDDDDDDDDESKYRTRQSRRKSNKLKFSAAQKGGGTIVRPSRYLFNDLGDGDDDQWVRRPLDSSASTKNQTEWYIKQMFHLMSENKIDQAQELFNSMKTKNIKPTVEVFNILIAGYGRIGKMRKAFNHYNNIKKMGLQPTGHTYTSMFSICSEISSKELALTQTMQLWEEFQTSVNSHNVKPDIITYNAALKAAASCPSFSLAMDIYHDILSKEVEPESRTYSSLLSACVEHYDSDKIQWILNEMKSHHIQPDIFVFNAILKALRNTRRTPSDVNSQETSDVEPTGEYNMTDILPNVSSSDSSSNVFTGIEDFLQIMAINDVIPDIRTFHLLLQVSDVDIDQEDYVLQVMKEWKLKPDLPILNALIKGRAFWGDITKAQEMKKDQIKPTENMLQLLEKAVTPYYGKDSRHVH